ncbi:MAG: phytanoyl-CoA dioxygenase [Gammaproteobacteria bacterium]|nr:phytanoyl-CoA dioxygenase [Gammaproteobacteria bacterium]
MPDTAQQTDAFSTGEQAAFARDGYVIVRNLAPPALMQRLLEVAEAQLAAQAPPLEFEADLHYPGAPASREQAGGRTVRRLLRAQSRDWAFTEWLTHPPLLNRVRQLLGPELIVPLAHHNCIMTKQPRFSSDTGWHQDTRYWAFQRPELVNAWLALGPEREDNGCMRLIPGSHRLELARERYDEQEFFREDLEENRELITQQQIALLEPGDVLFFHARTLHAATRNFSDRTKYSVVFTFRAADNPPRPGTRSASVPELLLPG